MKPRREKRDFPPKVIVFGGWMSLSSVLPAFPVSTALRTGTVRGTRHG
ncbi:hypothetical protein [Coleofasciculus sp. FACHB-64]|nr:hypothetical protein [Coleofasciculus sp. FACHB-64]